MENLARMEVEEIASRYALDFFTRHPSYRTKKQLAIDIENAIRDFINRAAYRIGDQK